MRPVRKMLLFAFSEQGHWGLVTCFKSKNKNKTKWPLSTHLSDSMAQTGASVFLELAPGYFLVWTQETEPEITNPRTDFLSWRGNAASHGVVSSAVPGVTVEACWVPWRETILFAIHLIHFHRDLWVGSIWKMLLCGLSNVLCEQVWISRATSIQAIRSIYTFFLAYFHIRQDSGWAGGGRYQIAIRKNTVL